MTTDQIRKMVSKIKHISGREYGGNFTPVEIVWLSKNSQHLDKQGVARAMDYVNKGRSLLTPFYFHPNKKLEELIRHNI